MEKVEKTKWLHINEYPGFDELKNSLEFVTYQNLSNFIIPPCGETDIKSLYNDLAKIKSFATTNQIQMPIFVDGLIQFETILNHYESDAFTDLGVSYTNSKTYFRKYDEQRIRNAGLDKIKDNFRYTILRAFNAAHSNVFPFGIRVGSSDMIIEAYDRSNLTEFSIINFNSNINTNNSNLTKQQYEFVKENIEYDVLKKSDLIDVINKIKYDFGSSYPPQLDKLLNQIVSDSASTTYNIFDCIGKDGIKNIIKAYQLVHILISNQSVISKELESLNNKNNPWLNINFFYQRIMQLSKDAKVSFVKETKLAQLNDEYTETCKYFNHLISQAPEYSLIPVMAFDVAQKSQFTLSNDDRNENFVNLANLMEGKDQEFLSKYIKEDKPLQSVPEFKYSLVNSLYSVECMEVWEDYKKKLTSLRNVLKKLKGNSKQSDELMKLTPSKIDGLTSKVFGYPVYGTLALLFAGDGKTIKNDDSNVVAAVRLFLETYFGDDVFEVDELTKTYKIKDTEFLTLLTDTDSNGYANSHSGRGEYFISSKLDDYKKAYQNHEDYRGTNEERADLHIEELKRITNLTKFGWWEDTGNGKVVYCGYDGNKKENVSWEHIQNPIQTYGAIRANETNSADGAKTKVFDTEVGYYEYILKQQSSPKVVKKYKTDFERQLVELQLTQIINYFKNESK